MSATISTESDVQDRLPGERTAMVSTIDDRKSANDSVDQEFRSLMEGLCTSCSRVLDQHRLSMFEPMVSGYSEFMTNDNASISNDDISTGPTQDDENLDAPSEHSKDTGDEPTEADENVDAPGEHSGDSGDES